MLSEIIQAKNTNIAHYHKYVQAKLTSNKQNSGPQILERVCWRDGQREDD
jgi:hypothetical protein